MFTSTYKHFFHTLEHDVPTRTRTSHFPGYTQQKLVSREKKSLINGRSVKEQVKNTCSFKPVFMVHTYHEYMWYHQLSKL